ncbi:Arrestin domain-containing protein 1 [Liparis tanakae]|uniref:Arrestin domain-containing protein 1 n=1 Tax=Liparis tanakae TaxID=230148 RepID=A0A4Z2E8X6_9TELE|nr:Arrestin domain-containing protein 1 [Liparis tanakae]
MGKLQDFQITFDQDKVVYSPGESITGTAAFRLAQPLQCKGERGQVSGDR